ncbi:hypothetical protein QQ045_023026 [Rhodiola kirilowii]
MSRKMLIDGEKEKGEDGQEAHYDYDLFVIGAGSGGVRAARFSANHGAKVGICELPFHPISSEVIGGVGGTCVIRGCVPKKILVYGASFGGELEDARSYGWELNNQINFNWKTLLQKKTEEINRLSGIYKRLLSNAGVKLFEGEGRVVGPNDVEVIQLDGTKLSFSAKHILIATGSRAQFPNIPGKNTVFGGKPSKADYNHIPCAVFCIPPLSVVGFTEEEAVQQANGDVLIYTSSFNPMRNTISGRQEKTIMKLIVDADTDKVVGASMCGPDAPEIMQGIAIALKCGATKAQFDSTVGIHPSAAEEFVTMRSLTRRVTADSKPKTNL